MRNFFNLNNFSHYPKKTWNCANCLFVVVCCLFSDFSTRQFFCCHSMKLLQKKKLKFADTSTMLFDCCVVWHTSSSMKPDNVEFACELNTFSVVDNFCFFFAYFRRKSMTGNWKTNQGSAMLEQMPITEKYKNWIDEVIKWFIRSYTYEMKNWHSKTKTETKQRQQTRPY